MLLSCSSHVGAKAAGKELAQESQRTYFCLFALVTSARDVKLQRVPNYDLILLLGEFRGKAATVYHRQTQQRNGRKRAR